MDSVLMCPENIGGANPTFDSKNQHAVAYDVRSLTAEKRRVKLWPYWFGRVLELLADTSLVCVTTVCFDRLRNDTLVKNQSRSSPGQSPEKLRR
jgi:hypothetical protein